MRITTSITLDFNGNVLHHSWYEYKGPLALAKGDDTAKAAEAQQAAMSSQLMSMMQTQFGKQSEVLDYLKGKMQPMIDNPTGYSAQALTAMRSGATDTIARQGVNATQAIQAREAAQGTLSGLPSGVNAQISGELAASQAGQQAGAQNEITLQNENFKQQNYWNAVGALSGTAQQFNPLGYAGASTGSANAVSGLSQAVTASSGPTFGSILGGLAGGALGAAGNAASGGATGGLSKLFGCWIAAAAFNEDFYTGTKTNLVRNWLWNDWSQHWYAKPILNLYSRFGERMAMQPLLVKMLRPLFRIALAKAERS